MINKYLKYFLFSLAIILMVSASSFCLARELEIDYPRLPTGEDISPGTSLPDYFIYMFKFGISLGFLAAFISLIIAGFFYVTAGSNPQRAARGKYQFWGAIIGLMLVVSVYVIATTINPELRFFRTHPLQSVPISTPSPVNPSGVRFFKQNNCPQNQPTNSSPLYRLSIPTFENDFQNKIKSVEVVNNPAKYNYYLGFLYEHMGWTGGCEYFRHDVDCKNIEPSASSATIFNYDFTPDGNGVTFYRKSFFNQEGGWFKVKNDQIKGGNYILDLERAYFQWVPEEDKTCTKWNFEGNCIERRPPKLSEGISSIKIDGNYFVVLLSPRTSTQRLKFGNCQAFPTPADANKIGPQQLKWEPIYTAEVQPKWAVIFPVTSKSFR